MSSMPSNADSTRSNFFLASSADPHRERARYILAHHPEVKQWMKPYRWSMVYAVILVGLQLAVGAWLTTMPWWWMPLMAFGLGSLISHALFVLIHDAVHQLIFKNKTVSKWVAIFINIGQGFPSGVPFGEFHINHHMHMGDYEKDTDIPRRAEGAVVKNNAVYKAIWLCFLGVVQTIRPLTTSTAVFHPWSLVNLAIVVGTNVLIYYFIGGAALGYLLLSTFFGLGIHPIGARWIQEHFIFKKDQETYSYYGSGNRLAFNVGYHNEHHDLPGIPWVYLPKLNQVANELYSPLYAHQSWIKLYFRFIFDKNISLFHRTVRS